MTSLDLYDVGVTYPVFEVGQLSLKSTLLRSAGGAFSSKGGIAQVQSLENISFQLRGGDRLALLGHNGAGKTTLLKVCGGILEPTQGLIESVGETISLTEIAMGMDPEVSGYENIMRRAVFMGKTRAEARELIPLVEEFSELGDYLALPVRTYSTGMYARLAFSISTSITPEILIMDEFIGAGDVSFVDKARTRMNDVVEQAQIIVLASHNMSLLRQVCQTGLLLEGGRCKFYGPIEDAITAYTETGV